MCLLPQTNRPSKQIVFMTRNITNTLKLSLLIFSNYELDLCQYILLFCTCLQFFAQRKSSSCNGNDLWLTSDEWLNVCHTLRFSLKRFLQHRYCADMHHSSVLLWKNTMNPKIKEKIFLKNSTKCCFYWKLKFSELATVICMVTCSQPIEKRLPTTPTIENQLGVHSSKVILERKYPVKLSQTNAPTSTPDTFLMMKIYDVIAAITSSFTSHITDQTAPSLKSQSLKWSLIYGFLLQLTSKTFAILKRIFKKAN